MFELDDVDVEILSNDTELLETFAEKYLADAIRIIMTKAYTPLDSDLLYEAVCILTAIYMRKVKDGEIEQNKTLH